jgi:hypothetical protein
MFGGRPSSAMPLMTIVKNKGVFACERGATVASVNIDPENRDNS